MREHLTRALLFFLLFLPLSVAQASATITGVEFFERPTHLDLMLTFDRSFKETLVQQGGKGWRGVILKNTTLNESVAKSLKHMGIESLTLLPKDGDVYLIVISAKAPSIVVSKMGEGYGLRLRLQGMQIPTPPSGSTPTNNAPSASPSASTPLPAGIKTNPSALPFKAQPTLNYTQYFVVILSLMALLVLLVLWRKRLIAPHKTSQGNASSWLFSRESSRKPPRESIHLSEQKIIDIHHRVITLESHGYRYLILLGGNHSGNLVIDRHPLDEAETQDRRAQKYIEGESFEALLEQKRDRLVQYLNERNEQTRPKTLSDIALEDFKARASRY